jgi:CBS domain containing-hemolysin-like protein
MSWLVGVVAAMVAMGSVLAMAEASISRMTRARALALHAEGRRNGALLEAVQRDPASYLNAIYLAVMVIQNGSAIIVALLAEHYVGELGVTITAFVFTLVYFVVVEAMSKTFAILHSDRVALLLAPLVWLLGRALALPTRALIGLANILLPGKGLKQGPFVSEHEIHTIADFGHEEGVIEESEKDMIHSVLHLGDILVREVMVPRPDVAAIEAERSIREAHDLAVRRAFSRYPAYRGDLDHTEGIVHIKDILAALRDNRHDAPVSEILRPPHFVPQTSRAAVLLREMQSQKFHMSLVVDEYGSVSGLVTIEDVLEQLVGDIAEEHEQEARDIVALPDGRYRVDAAVSIHELNQEIGIDLPRDKWNTVGGLMYGMLGAIPSPGQSVVVDGLRFTAEKADGRRVTSVLVSREPDTETSADG